MIRRASSHLWIPSSAQGFARCRAAAARPHLRDSLEGLWHFSPASAGSRVLDYSPRARHGTWHGTGERWSVWRAGWSGVFNGADDYVVLPHPALWPPPATIVLWAIPASYALGVLFAQTSSGSDTPVFEMGWLSEGACYLFLRDDQQHVVSLKEPGGAHCAGEPVLVASVSRSLSRHELWINGRLAASSATDLGPMTTDRMSIAAAHRSQGVVDLFAGRIPWVAAWSRALAPAEIGLMHADPNGLVRAGGAAVTRLRRPEYLRAGQVDVAGQAAGQAALAGAAAGQIAV